MALSRDKRYQLSNRVAFAWKLASEGVPVVLVYLGFTGDEVIGCLSSPIQDDVHWRAAVYEHAAEVLPPDIWERRIDTAQAPLWLLVRSLPAFRQSPPRVAAV